MRSETFPAAMQWLLISVSGLLLVGNAGCGSRLRANKTTPLPAGNLTAHWESPLHPTAPLSFDVARQRWQAAYSRVRFSLKSPQPYNEVDLPLIIRDNKPYVQAFWSGRQIECEVDTGSSGISWPQWRHLDTQHLNIPVRVQWPQGPLEMGEWILSPRISLGGLTLLNMPTVALGYSKPASFNPAEADPIMGMIAFQGVILTIDYTHKRLVIRDKHYDITRQPHKSHSLLLHYQSHSDPRVILPGTLAGHPARYLLDSACKSMLIGSSFAHKYLPVVPVPTPPPPGKLGMGTTWPGVRHPSCTLIGVHFTPPIVYVIDRADPADVLLGAPLFKKYRITVDSYRGVVLIEYNPQTQHPNKHSS